MTEEFIVCAEDFDRIVEMRGAPRAPTPAALAAAQRYQERLRRTSFDHNKTELSFKA